MDHILHARDRAGPLDFDNVESKPPQVLLENSKL
jgi:hypothetical protein